MCHAFWHFMLIYRMPCYFVVTLSFRPHYLHVYWLGLDLRQVWVHVEPLAPILTWVQVHGDPWGLVLRPRLRPNVTNIGKYVFNNRFLSRVSKMLMSAHFSWMVQKSFSWNKNAKVSIFLRKTRSHVTIFRQWVSDSCYEQSSHFKAKELSGKQPTFSNNSTTHLSINKSRQVGNK